MGHNEEQRTEKNSNENLQGTGCAENCKKINQITELKHSDRF